MLQSMEQFKQAEMQFGPVVNGVDNPSLLSVDSTDVIETPIDQVGEAEDNKEKKQEATAPSTEQKKSELSQEEHKEEEKSKEETSSQESQHGKDAVQKRIDELTKKRRTAERERDWERTKRLELEEEVKKLRASIPASDKPKREDFETDDEFIEALTDWKVETKAAELQNKAIEKANEEELKKASDEAADEYGEVVEAGKEKYADFEEVALSKDLAISNDMLDAIMSSELSADIFYYLGKNPDLAVSMYNMSAARVTREIIKLEAELLKPPTEEKKEEPKAAPVKKLTNTPAPIEPVKTTGAVDKDPSQMSSKEYRAWRERNKE